MLIRKRPLWADAAPQGYSWQAEGGLDDCPQVPWATTLHNTQPAEQLLEALGLAFVIKRQSSSRGEAKDTSLLSSRDGYILELTVWPKMSVHGILQARTLEWVAISFSNAGK